LISPANQQDAKNCEQRSERRYVVSANLEYMLGPPHNPIALGQGRLMNISLGGILFEATQPIVLEAEVELFIEWPVRRKGKEPIYLRILGETIRTQGICSAVKILRYEFPAR
jgi:hypothetical protein